jgi:hypothetical protein
MQKGAPTIEATFTGQERILLLDTGSSICLVQPAVHPGTLRTANMSQIGVTGDALHVRGTQNIEFRLKQGRFTHRFYVCSVPTEADDILWSDFLRRSGVTLDAGRQELRIKRGPKADLVQRGRERSHERDRRVEIAFTTLRSQGSNVRGKRQARIEDSDVAVTKQTVVGSARGTEHRARRNIEHVN